MSGNVGQCVRVPF